MPATQYTLDLRGPLELVRGQTTTLTPKLFSEAATEVTPTSWTGSLWYEQAQLLTGTGSGAVALALAIPATYALSDDYEVRWSIVHAAGRLEVRQAATVCLSGLYPTLTAAEIYARAPALNPAATGALRIWGAGQSILTLAAEAWRDVLQELRARGVRPRLITQPEDLRGVHLARTMALCWRSVATSLNDSTYLEHARDADTEYQQQWARLSLRQAPPDQRDGGAAQAGGRAPLLGGAWQDYAAGRYWGEPGQGRRGGVL